MEDCIQKEDKEFLLNTGVYREESYRPPHHRKRYWIISFLAHAGIMGMTMCGLFFAHSQHMETSRPVQSKPIDHDAHLVGDYSSPLNGHEKYIIDENGPDYWNSKLYFGEPSYESDWAWNDFISPRSFRVHRKEAERLNFNDSILVSPGEDFASMLGVMHNLHCLRRIRQVMYPDYYYKDAAEDFMEHNREHALHCLESLRTSVTCYPDLNPHPYYYSGHKYHDITVSAKVTRKCVNWPALQERLRPRHFQPEEMMENTGPPS